MNNILDFLNNIFIGINITEDEKRILLGSYLIRFYAASLQELLTVKPKDKKYIEALDEFINKWFSTLPAEEQKYYTETMEEEKDKLLGELISKIHKNLSPQDQKRFEENIKNLPTNNK